MQDFEETGAAREVYDHEALHQIRLTRLASLLGKTGGWRYDVREDRLEWSEETARLHDEPEGFSPSVEQGISYYIPEHREHIRKQFETCLTEGRPFDETLQIETPKGRQLWVKSIGKAVCNESGQIVAVEGALQDVTDLIIEQQRSRALSDRLRDTLEGMSDAFYLLDSEWRFVFLNSKAEKMLQRRKEDLIGRVVWDEFHEASGNIKSHYEIAIQEKRAIRFEEYYHSLETWFEICADPSPSGLAVYFRDVTEDRRQKAQLKLLEASISRLNDILLISEAEPIDDPSGGPKIVYVNDAFERRTGFGREEVIGHTPRILQGPKTQRSELDRIRSALENWQPVRAELINYTKSGEEFWLELDIVPLADEKGWFTHWIAVERDITERKHADLTLKASEERFRLITMAVGSAIWDWDVANDQHWWSEGLREIFGHELDPDGTLETNWRRFVHADDLARVEAAIQGVLSGQDSSLRMQYRFQRADGSWAIVDDNAFAMRDESGKVFRVLGSLNDISEQKLLEDRLRQAQKMEAVGQLTGGVAHDFNNLLTIIVGAAENLSEQLDSLPDLQELAQMALDAAESGAELTDRLLAFSRKQALQPKVLDVSQLVQGLDALLRRTLPENIGLEIIRSGGLWKIEADASQLESAILNLVVNARDAMPDGGTLTIEMANARLNDEDLVADPDVRPGEYVAITVTDNGTGMPADVLARVFEPFFTTKETGKGSGLGLSMVFGFVKQSGGHIRFYSEPGEGTAATLYFPRTQVDQEPLGVATSPREIIGGSETILVVEDNDIVLKYVSAQLQALGYDVIQATNGADALKVAGQSQKIDLLFTDVVMPGRLGGRQLAEAVSELRPGIKTLFTSGYTESSIVHHGRLDPGVKLLKKPYRRDILAKTIRDILDESEVE